MGGIMRAVMTMAAAASLWPATAQSKPCAEYVGETVNVIAFEQAVAGLGKVDPKGEFETTSQYEARIAGVGSSGPLIIGKKPEGSEYFLYDADRQLLFVKTYAFHNTNMGWWSAFYDAKPAGITASTMYNKAVVISQNDKPAGSYVAQNSYGAKATVTKIERSVTSIFESEASSYKDRLFVNEADGVLGTLPMDVATAQRTKPALKTAFVVVPKAPYLVQGSHSVGKTTVTNPTDVTEHYKILIADMQCGLLMDGGSKVLAAYAMN